MGVISRLLRIRLKNHNHIVYDLDGALFGIFSEDVESYIKDNPNKKHSIITSKQCSMEQHSMVCLYSMFGIPLPFEHIIHSPSSELEGHLVDSNFKGNECKRIGATALVDDWGIHRHGCDINNIAFVHIHQPM